MSKERQKYKIAGAATWELIRAAYLGGESAPALAERFGVNVHGIRKRITKEGWTKRDYVAALEARGVTPPAKPKPNFIEEGVLREQVRVAAEEAEATKREAETHAWIERVAAEEEAPDIADALERRALAEASAALVQGRSKDAQALASLAEQMKKHRGERAAPVARPTADDERAPAAESEEADASQRAAMMMELFGRVAFLANAMVHQPSSAPAVFLRMVKRWREINLGEGAEDAEVAAALVAKAHKHHLDGAWLETTPEDVRAYLSARWDEVRASFE